MVHHECTKFKTQKSKIMEKVPTLAELHEDVSTAFKNDQVNLLLNQPPHEGWLKNYPDVMGIKGKYLPIDKIEFMLTRIFQRWYVQVIGYSEVFQSVAVHVRLHYYNPYTDPGEWQYQDGVGASGIQTDKGATAADLGAIKLRAVQMALPIAKTAAIKDAAEQLGTLFGRDLNRKDTLMFAGAFPDAEPKDSVKGFTKRYDKSHELPPVTTGTTFIPTTNGQLVEKQTPPIQQAQPAFTPSFTFNPSEL